jgi:hypothetical protein
LLPVEVAAVEDYMPVEVAGQADIEPLLDSQ